MSGEMICVLVCVCLSIRIHVICSQQILHGAPFLELARRQSALNPLILWIVCVTLIHPFSYKLHMMFTYSLPYPVRARKRPTIKILSRAPVVPYTMASDTNNAPHGSMVWVVTFGQANNGMGLTYGCLGIYTTKRGRLKRGLRIS